MYEIAIMTIQEYIDEYLFEPQSNWPKYEFCSRCYERWTANELLKRIADESALLPEHITGMKKRSPFNIINDFIQEMDECFEVSDSNQDCQLIFSTARETAIDIILLFL